MNFLIKKVDSAVYVVEVLLAAPAASAAGIARLQTCKDAVPATAAPAAASTITTAATLPAAQAAVWPRGGRFKSKMLVGRFSKDSIMLQFAVVSVYSCFDPALRV